MHFKQFVENYQKSFENVSKCLYYSKTAILYTAHQDHEMEVFYQTI